MKRILLGMIAAGMCLVLCSCNQEAQQEPQPYEALLTYMDAQEYEKAYQELLSFSSEYKDIQENYEKKRKHVLGTWTAISDKERESFTLKADGTCKLSTTNKVYYYNKEKIEVVEITEDNFWDYFEVHAFPKWYKNGWGEVSDASYKTCFCLKADYVPNLLTRENEVDFEYKAVQCANDMTVDLQNQIMDVGEFEYQNRMESKVAKTAHWDGAFSIEEDCEGYYPVVFADSVDSLYIYSHSNWVKAYLYSDFEIMQARGQLVWIK